MSAGLLAIYSFTSPMELGPLIYYGLLSMRNRGDAFVAYVHDGSGIRRVEVSEKLSIRGMAAIGCAWAEDCCMEGPDYVMCQSGSEGTKPGEKPRSTTYVALTRAGDLHVYRSSLWHMAIGAYGFDLAIAATETATIEVLGGEVRRSLIPGELLIINRYGVRRELSEAPRNVCILEVAYTMRPDSSVNGVPVVRLRREIVRLLMPIDSDAVIGIPETGDFYASLLALESGKPYIQAFVRTTSKRSAILNDMDTRLSIIQLKANPIEDSLRGKRVFLIDDSLITGATMKTISQILRHRAGVKEIKAAVVLPPLTNEYPYGAATPKREIMAANNLTKEQLKLALEVDELRWPEANDVERVLRSYGITPCLKCLMNKAQET